jgi:hypothetical protein
MALVLALGVFLLIRKFVGSHETIKFLQASGILHGYSKFYQAGYDLKKSAEQ